MTEAPGPQTGPDDSWVTVRAGETEPFSFGSRGRLRGAARAHAEPQRLHQLALRLDGWAPPAPVAVDRAGVYWRELSHAVSAIHYTSRSGCTSWDLKAIFRSVCCNILIN